MNAIRASIGSPGAALNRWIDIDLQLRQVGLVVRQFRNLVGNVLEGKTHVLKQ